MVLNRGPYGLRPSLGGPGFDPAIRLGSALSRLEEPSSGQNQPWSARDRLGSNLHRWSDTVVRRMGRRATGSVTQRANGRFYVRLTKPDGRRTTRGGYDTRRDAEAAIPALMAELHDEHDTRLDVGLAVFIEDHYRAVMRSRLGERTLAIQLAQLTEAAAWIARKRDLAPMRDVTRADAEAYVAHIMTTRTAATTHRHLSTLALAWDAAIARGMADQNPWRRHKLRREQEYHVPWVSPEGLRRIVARVAERHRDFVQLLADTGLRRGEAYGLTWSCVDLERGVVTVLESKSRKSREVPLMGATAELLERRRQQRVAPIEGPDLVFADLPTPEMLRQDLTVACAAAGEPRLRVHDLRHLYASHLVRSGAPVPAVAALLGHQDGGALVLRRYGRWAPQDAGATAVAGLAGFRAPGRATRGTSSG